MFASLAYIMIWILNVVMLEACCQPVALGEVVGPLEGWASGESPAHMSMCQVHVWSEEDVDPLEQYKMVVNGHTSPENHV